MTKMRNEYEDYSPFFVKPQDINMTWQKLYLSQIVVLYEYFYLMLSSQNEVLLTLKSRKLEKLAFYMQW